MKWSAWEWVIIIFAVTVCMVLLMNIIGVIVLKIPTNADNSALRLKMADLLNSISSSILTIVAMKFRDMINKKDQP